MFSPVSAIQTVTATAIIIRRAKVFILKAQLKIKVNFMQKYSNPVFLTFRFFLATLSYTLRNKSLNESG